jgi:hypothetical protein
LINAADSITFSIHLSTIKIEIEKRILISSFRLKIAFFFTLDIALNWCLHLIDYCWIWSNQQAWYLFSLEWFIIHLVIYQIWLWFHRAILLSLKLCVSQRAYFYSLLVRWWISEYRFDRLIACAITFPQWLTSFSYSSPETSF